MSRRRHRFWRWRARRSAVLTRAERAERIRRERARAHLARVRSRAPGPPPLRGVAAALAALSLGAGALLGEPVTTAAIRWLARGSAIEAIHVRGAAQLPPAEIAAATGVPPGAALASIDAAAIAGRLSQHPWIEEARAVRWATGRLLVEVVEREAVAVVTAGGTGEAFAVDASGIPFAPARPEDLEAHPRIAAPGGFAPGEASDELARAVRLAQRIPELGLGRPAEIRLAAAGDPEGLSLRLEGRPARFVLGWEELDDRLARLARLLAAGVPELEGAASVDLRFADQTVLRKRPLPGGAAQAAAARGRAAPSKPRPSG